MKTKLILLFFLFISFTAFGQNQEKLKGFSITPPQFTGVESAVPVIIKQQYPSILDYMKTHITYPEEAVRYGMQGTVVLGFTVTAEGKITRINVINSVSTKLDEEVIYALERTSGMWKPAYINDEPTEQVQEVSIAFKLDDLNNNDFTQSAGTYYTKACEQLLVKHNNNKALRYFDKGIVLLPDRARSPFCDLLLRCYAASGIGPGLCA